MPLLMTAVKINLKTLFLSLISQTAADAGLDPNHKPSSPQIKSVSILHLLVLQNDY